MMRAMTFQAYCPYCETKVSALTLLDGDDFGGRLKKVMHVSADGDHPWELNNHEKENLRNMKANRMFP
jgi:hypothetical protein